MSYVPNILLKIDNANHLPLQRRHLLQLRRSRPIWHPRSPTDSYLKVNLCSPRSHDRLYNLSCSHDSEPGFTTLTCRASPASLIHPKPVLPLPYRLVHQSLSSLRSSWWKSYLLFLRLRRRHSRYHWRRHKLSCLKCAPWGRVVRDCGL